MYFEAHNQQSLYTSSLAVTAHPGLGCNEVLVLSFSTSLLLRVLLLVTSYILLAVLLLLLALLFLFTFILCNEVFSHFLC